jgi:hypothetical protein
MVSSAATVIVLVAVPDVPVAEGAEAFPELASILLTPAGAVQEMAISKVDPFLPSTVDGATLIDGGSLAGSSVLSLQELNVNIIPVNNIKNNESLFMFL